MVIGDMNAEIGSSTEGYEELMGRHGLGVMNGTGERVANLCAKNDLVIGGSVFPRKRTPIATWASPDHSTENQIDHICVSRRFGRLLQIIRVRRGADVASDQHLLVASLKMKMKQTFS